MAGAFWLWDHLRRSVNLKKKNNLKGAGGFFLPLSGGADSTATASIVFNLC